jgi:hypothetical protein
MWFRSITDLVAQPARRRTRLALQSKQKARRLFLESLEDRCLLAFDLAVNYAAGTNPQAVVTADFNNDNIEDLAVVAVASYASSDVNILLGNPDGTFQPALTLPAGANPLSLAVGDFDEDGNLDLATAGFYDLSFMRGDGQGSFGAPTSIGFVGNPSSVATGDFNGDGLLDLGVTSNYYLPGYCYYGYYCSGNSLGYANVLLGNGNGSFTGPNSTPLGYGYFTAAIAANLNGAGADEFITVNLQNGYLYGAVAVLADGGNDFLQLSNILYTGADAQGVAAGDLNGDNAFDLVTVNASFPSVSVFLSDGLGGFGSPVNYATGGYPVSVILGDFTQDGILDAATVNVSSNQVAVLHGAGDGTFSTPVLAAVGSFPWAIAAVDFNGDGWLDAATANTGSGNVSVLINDQSWPAPPPSATILDATVNEGHTGAATANFTVRLSSDPTEPVTINYSTADGSATTADSDYQSVSGSLTFHPGGPLTQTIAVPVNGDRRGELSESFFVNITSTTAHIADAQATGTIFDDEPTVSIGDASVTEGHSGTTAMSFVVTLSATYDAAVAMSFATQDGTATTGNNDYLAGSGMLTFAPGDTSETITVVVKGDLLVEPDENFFVNLSDSASAILADGQGFGAILTDDATKFYVVDASSDKTFEYGATGQAVESYSLGWGNINPRGVASYVGGDRVWGIDNDEYVDVYDASGYRLGFWKANGLRGPEGIASNGTDIWIVDRDRDRVYRYAGAASRTSGSMSPTSSFALNSGNRDAKGIETDGKHFWVVDDGKTNKVFKYTLSGTFVGSWTISGANTSPTGITLDPSNPSDIWIVDSGRDQVFQYMAAAGRTSGSQSPGAVFNLAPGNTNPQGIADPPPPSAAVPIAASEPTGFDARTALLADLALTPTDDDGELPALAQSKSSPRQDQSLPTSGLPARDISTDRRWRVNTGHKSADDTQPKAVAVGDLDQALVVDAALASYLAQSPSTLRKRSL